MKEYDRLNPSKLDNLVRAYDAEWDEFREAKSIRDKFCEGCDVIHTIIKLYGFRYHLPIHLINICCCIFVPYTAYKHGHRYYSHGCIRSMNNCTKVEKDHKCRATLLKKD